MRIGFDARMIDHPGIGRYIKNLLEAMVALSEDAHFILYGDPEKLRDFKNCEIREHLVGIYSFREFFTSPFEKDEFDLVHIPHFNIPFQPRNRLVITTHDFIYLKFPESLPDRLKTIAVEAAFRNAVTKADKIIAVSENTKKDIIEYFPETEDKIEVIYEAADPAFTRIEDRGRKEKIKQRYNLPEDFMLSVGSLKRHKNIERLIDAYIDLKAKGVKHKLVIVGRYRPREKNILKKIRTTDALYLGEIPTDDLVVLYNLAALFVMPSLYEGFGLPVFEAMACGVPVVSSFASSLPEIIGHAALFFDPCDIEDISNKIYDVIKNENLRIELIEKGLRRAETFSWEKTAEKTLALYKEILGYKG